jgi:hypothetical protein
MSNSNFNKDSFEDDKTFLLAELQSIGEGVAKQHNSTFELIREQKLVSGRNVSSKIEKNGDGTVSFNFYFILNKDSNYVGVKDAVEKKLDIHKGGTLDVGGTYVRNFPGGKIIKNIEVRNMPMKDFNKMIETIRANKKTEAPPAPKAWFDNTGNKGDSKDSSNKDADNVLPSAPGGPTRKS